MRLKVDSGGGLQAVIYTLKKALEVGPLKLWQRMRSKNACKTCALGMGGMRGGMVNEAGHFPEVCKKSLQAQAADMKGEFCIVRRKIFFINASFFIRIFYTDFFDGGV